MEGGEIVHKFHWGAFGAAQRSPTHRYLSAQLRLLLLVLGTILVPAACSGGPPPASGIAVPDCSVAAIPGLVEAPAPPEPIDAAGSVVAAGAGAGALAGSGSVTPAGEYRYRIPIDVPPGRAGMAPSLALTYASRGKNGHLGVGWQIEGLSEIDRCPRTFAVDGLSDGVRLDDHDAFCLDGHELVKLGAYEVDGCAGDEYRTEDDTFARIVSCGQGNTIASFRVFSKDGRIRDYAAVPIPSDYGGRPPGDNPMGGTVDFAWLLSKDQDRAGNSIRYTYKPEPVDFGATAADGVTPLGAAIEYYPTRIDYTFQETTGEAGQRSIVFGYGKPLVHRPDPSFSYVAGVRVNVTRRLATIDAWAPNPTTPEKVWHYDLTYDTSHGSGASLLVQVQRCGALGGCLPAKQFGWQSSAGAQWDHIQLSHSSLVGVPIVLDLDGDGRDDVVYAAENGQIIVLDTLDPSKPLLHEGSVMAEGGFAEFDAATARPIDLDGDGRDELIVPGTQPGEYDVLSLATSLAVDVPAFSALHIPALDATPAYFADLDGDGLPDLIGGAPRSSSAWDWSFQMNAGGFAFKPAVAIGDPSTAPLTVGGVPTSFAADQGQHRATIYYGKTTTGFSPGQLVGLLLDTQGHPGPGDPVPQPSVAPGQQPPLTAFADMNGDGLHELITVAPVATGIGIGVSGAWLVQVTSPDQEVTTVDSTFFTTTTTDPLGHMRRVERDFDDRVLVSVGITAQGGVSTIYGYGDFDQLETTTDADGNVVRVHYDRRGRRTRVDDPDAGYRTFAYDGFGDLTESSVNGTVTTTYALDALGRVTEADADTGDSTTWTWDTSPHGLGRLAHATSPDGTAQDLLYDPVGRLATETWTIDGAPFRFDFGYDALGRLGEIDYPEVPGRPRFSVGYDYNAAGALRDVFDAASLAPYWTGEERNEDDRLLEAALGNGFVQTRSYDDTTGRLEAAFDGSPTATALSLTYDYDDAGHVWHRTDKAASRAETFGYDALERLQRWTLSTWISLPSSNSVSTPIHTTEYGYDPLGDLKTVTVDGALVESNDYGAGAGPHALTSNSAGMYDYDDRGRQTQAPERAVTYTELDLPRTVTTAAGLTSFAYDAANARVKKDGPAGTVVTLAGLYERRSNGGSVEHVFYVRGPEGTIAQVRVGEGSGTSTTEYLHLDALGSVGAVSDAGGQPSATMYYEPFGARRDVNGSALASIGGDVPVGFTGDRHDDELGLIDMRGRVYDPGLRRFLTPDPHVTDPLWGQSYNRYSYVVNDPVNLVDPSGLDGTDPDPNGPDYPQGCGAVFGCGGGSDGGVVVVDLPGPQGGGSSVSKYPSGGPVLTAIARPISIPVGPSAPATSILGPLGLAWLHPQSPDFYRQVWFDIAQQIAYNNALWEAAAPIREQVAHWYGKGLSTPAKDQMWWDMVGGKGPPPIGFGYWGPRAGAGAGELQGAEIVNYGLAAASVVGIATRAAGGALAGMRVGEAAASAAEAAAGAGANGAAEGTTTLYRAVSEAELMDIGESGVFRSGPGSMGNKWFAESAEDAASWGKQFFKMDGQPFFTVRVHVPNSIAEQMMRIPMLDGIGPARSAEGVVLDLLNQNATIDVLAATPVP